MRSTLGILLTILCVACNEQSSGRTAKTVRQAPTTQTPAATATILVQTSQMAHSTGIAPITTAQEITGSLGTLPSGYRAVPVMSEDNEKNEAQSVQILGRPTVTCGIGNTFSGIESRIADCASKNSSTSTWIGSVHGKAGEGTWTLVALDASNPNATIELWRDGNTGLLWTDIVTSANWCKASGNIQGPTNVNMFDCQSSAGNTSYCHGSSPFSTLGMTSSWRLPTRNDFLQADLNGARFVLKNGTSAGFWTATVNSASAGPTEAWSYQYAQGLITSQPMMNSLQIRCVGAAAN